MTTYPRVFKLIRDRADRPAAALGHVADGIEWTARGPVTLRWKGFHSSVATFPTMDSVRVVHGHYDHENGRYDTRVVYDTPPPRIDKRAFELLRALEFELGDYVTTVEKKTHIARAGLMERLGALQDLFVDAAVAQTVDECDAQTPV